MVYHAPGGCGAGMYQPANMYQPQQQYAPQQPQFVPQQQYVPQTQGPYMSQQSNSNAPGYAGYQPPQHPMGAPGFNSHTNPGYSGNHSSVHRYDESAEYPPQGGMFNNAGYYR